MLKRPHLLLIAIALAISLASMLGCTAKAEQVTGTFKDFAQSPDGRTLAVVVVEGSEATQTAWIKIRGLTPGEKVVLEKSGGPSQDGMPTLTVIGHKR